MSEAQEIKRAGMTPVKNSGRGTDKGDAVLNPFLVDIKEYNESFSVSRTNWAKLTKDALSNGLRQPAFMLALGAEEKVPLRLWVISDVMFHEMREAWVEKYGQ